jgi:hypothetical protein
MATGTPVGAGDFLISKSNAGDQSSPSLATSGNQALVTWHSNDNGLNNDLRGRFVNIDTGLPMGSGDFLIGSTTANNQLLPQLAASNGRALVSWQDENTSGNDDIRGAVLDFNTVVPLPYGLNHFFTAPMIERNYTVTTRLQY